MKMIESLSKKIMNEWYTVTKIRVQAKIGVVRLIKRVLRTYVQHLFS